MRVFLERLLLLVRNKFFLITVAFIVWIFFFAEYDLISQYKQRNELKEMKQKIEYLEGEIARLQKEKESILNDTLTLEKYAREKYFMKEPNEDVYIFDTLKR